MDRTVPLFYALSHLRSCLLRAPKPSGNSQATGAFSLLSLFTTKNTLHPVEMTRVGGGRRDKTSDSILPESRLRNEEAADKIRKLLVPEG